MDTDLDAPTSPYEDRLTRVRGGDVAGTAAALGSAVLFASAGVSSASIGSSIGSLPSAMWRLAVGGAVLAAVAGRRGATGRLVATDRTTARRGAAAAVVFQAGWFVAAALVGPATATIVALGVAPAAALVLASRGGERAAITNGAVGGAVVCLLGVGVLAADRPGDVAGIGVAALAGCAIPVTATAIRRLASNRTVPASVAAVFGRAGAVAAGVLAIAAAFDPAGWMPTSPSEVVVIGHLGVVTLALAYRWWASAIGRIGVARTVTLAATEPAFALAASVVVLDLRVAAPSAIACAVVTFGVAVGAARPARRPVRRIRG
jgi:DME family drug/metabolite transporter